MKSKKEEVREPASFSSFFLLTCKVMSNQYPGGRLWHNHNFNVFWAAHRHVHSVHGDRRGCFAIATIALFIPIRTGKTGPKPAPAAVGPTGPTLTEGTWPCLSVCQETYTLKQKY